MVIQRTSLHSLWAEDDVTHRLFLPLLEETKDQPECTQTHTHFTHITDNVPLFPCFSHGHVIVLKVRMLIIKWNNIHSGCSRYNSVSKTISVSCDNVSIFHQYLIFRLFSIWASLIIAHYSFGYEHRYIKSNLEISSSFNLKLQIIKITIFINHIFWACDPLKQNKAPSTGCI